MAASNQGGKIVTLGSNFVIFLGSKKKFFFEQQNYLFGQQILMGKAANFISKGSRFYRD
jgi:hypothetical protein